MFSYLENEIGHVSLGCFIGQTRRLSVKGGIPFCQNWPPRHTDVLSSSHQFQSLRSKHWNVLHEKQFDCKSLTSVIEVIKSTSQRKLLLLYTLLWIFFMKQHCSKWRRKASTSPNWTKWGSHEYIVLKQKYLVSS